MNFIGVMMSRDGLSLDEAREEKRWALGMLREALENGEDLEEAFMLEYGLEPDYLEEFLPWLL